MSRPSRFDWVSRFGVLIFVVIVMSIVQIQNVQAIGVTPGRNTVDFEPGLDKKYSFTILNNEKKDFNAIIYVEGELKDYITIKEQLVSFDKNMSSYTFTYRLKLPKEMDKPGDHWGRIVVMEAPKVELKEGQNVIGTIAVVHQVRVKAPYPGKYAEADLVISDAQVGETVMFYVKISNFGKENILRVKATIDILGPTNEVLDTFETGEIGIKPKMRGELIAGWKADVNSGIYHAVVVVNYDGKLIRLEKNFGVGNMLIDVREITVKNFRLGGVAKFDILVENKWNQEITGVYAEMTITDEKGDVIANFKSASEDMKALGKATLYAYWDTEGVEKGVYDANLKLHYAGKTTEKRLKTHIELESITTEIIGVTAKAVTVPTAGRGPDILTPLVIILIMINMGWFFYFRRRKG